MSVSQPVTAYKSSKTSSKLCSELNFSSCFTYWPTTSLKWYYFVSFLRSQPTLNNHLMFLRILKKSLFFLHITLTWGILGRASSKVIRLAAVLRWPGWARFEALSGSGHCQDKDTYICYNTTTQQNNSHIQTNKYITPETSFDLLHPISHGKHLFKVHVTYLHLYESFEHWSGVSNIFHLYYWQKSNPLSLVTYNLVQEHRNIAIKCYIRKKLYD